MEASGQDSSWFFESNNFTILKLEEETGEHAIWSKSLWNLYIIENVPKSEYGYRGSFIRKGSES